MNRRLEAIPFVDVFVNRPFVLQIPGRRQSISGCVQQIQKGVQSSCEANDVGQQELPTNHHGETSFPLKPLPKTRVFKCMSRKAWRFVGAWLMPALCASCSAFAQNEAKLTFDVASVKPSNATDPRTSIEIEPSGRFAASATLKALIGFAYDIQDRDIVGGSGWIDSELFQIDARRSGATPPPIDSLREMLRSLLADRFKLSVRSEKRREAIYELLPAKGGPKLTESTSPGPPRLSNGRGRISGKAADTGTLTRMLAGRLGRGVVDKTGLKGSYDFELNWVPVPGERDDGAIAGSLKDPEGPTIFTALQEQLGLRLRSARGQVETLVIDHAERPDRN